ncbi:MULTISPECIES: aspartate aminotransferase family protein [unclassified Shinella]|uniref:aspartate aminotransferase family protein n=1 Tax=unclassified Shinella TaxID=2643062 RepID=UPI00225DB370|nr:aminotransferase class III-fold pyridoxal phosphate-dependent enzyme [Shinella sp. YE25]MDC7258856.1 aminotransferase class III-fold pyridoxal phosphate-dependent enzyme [Shinella sp. YE25]CAI0334367.1 Glutamate-1-semialdehyde 2,1-aminomutase [Rhizobiaceae bacterium]CAK7260550.1 Glutamate-1-semialdehyde 2,1-aminomutase [Shinella sp. WSC3-e]
MQTTQRETPGFTNSRQYREYAVRHLANGVSSTPRTAQLPVPVAMDRALDAILTDVDGNDYIDYTMGYGPLILGHNPPEVVAALKAEIDKGFRTASVHRGEGRLAELIAETVPCGEISSFVSTGTEAVQLALRIARAATGRTRIIKFRANYHGWFDSVHVANAPGNDGPGSGGQDPKASENITVVDWGDAAALEKVISSDYAAVILEAAAVNAGCFAPPEGFLQAVRDLTRKHGVVLIFDEVITGYRLALGGAQEMFGVTPDIAVLGKAIGAGMPISAVTGSRAVMEALVDGRVMHRGTFNGNPLSVSAAIACVERLQRDGAEIYPRMTAQAAAIQAHINAEAAALDLDVCANGVGSAVQIFTGVRQMANIADLAKADRSRIVRLTEMLMMNGLMPLPRGLMYLSAAHTDGDIETTLHALSKGLRAYAAL